MAEFYYLDGVERMGPFSMEELKAKRLPPSTLVWNERMHGWTRMEEVPEMYGASNGQGPVAAPSSVAYHVPSIKKMADREPFAVTLKRYRLVIAWCIFHACALFFSTNEVKFFNDTGQPRPERFWPFVKFTESYFIPDNNKTFVKFNGIFTQYDWSEFSFYVGIAVLFVVVRYVYKRSE